ncbi:hypothetical protein [Allorhizobium terrae]|uniref:Uncharacterized protein n=1 Tax=Allorhizobium terrae TaxID=1848972 RepID=A0A4S4A548_9HYPH|nr:hypothetical protein [Allorhizobium terrae]THF53622.1 hypothetical protein E6C51_00390 [Allorhizobium terrae]
MGIPYDRHGSAFFYQRRTFLRFYLTKSQIADDKRVAFRKTKHYRCAGLARREKRCCPELAFCVQMLHFAQGHALLQGARVSAFF